MEVGKFVTWSHWSSSIPLIPKYHIRNITSILTIFSLLLPKNGKRVRPVRTWEWKSLAAFIHCFPDHTSVMPSTTIHLHLPLREAPCYYMSGIIQQIPQVSLGLPHIWFLVGPQHIQPANRLMMSYDRLRDQAFKTQCQSYVSRRIQPDMPNDSPNCIWPFLLPALD